jgi:predicted DNA-binding protein with PD1-like motif
MHHITKRLLPGQDLREGIERLVQDEHINAGVILSLVGSLRVISLRVADGKTIHTWHHQAEIVSATGTLSHQGCHIHISVAGQNAATLGGHLAYGCIINTTVELVVTVFDGVIYKRRYDAHTRYNELIEEKLRDD